MLITKGESNLSFFMMYYTYIIRSLSNGKYYIGYTSDLKQRLFEHNQNKTKSLRNRGPFEFVYFEGYQDKTEARKRELQIKSYKGGNAFKKLVGSL